MTDKHVEFVDQTIRDGQQSLWGMRMTAGMALPILPHLDTAGYRVIDHTGGAMFTVQAKQWKQSPWETTRALTSRTATPLRAAIRADGIMMGPAPDDLMDLWVERLVAAGIRSFWVFDVLFHHERMSRIIRLAKSFGVEVVGAVMFTESPYHTDDYYAAKIKELSTLPIDGLYLEDTAGVMTPERVRTLVPAIHGVTDVPIEAHFHNTTGLAPLCYVEALRAGVRTLHTAVPPLADRGSLPSAPLMLKLVRQLGLESSLNEDHFGPVGDHLRFVAEREGYLLGGGTDYDLDVYKHQIPGGMMGTLRVQLAELNLTDRTEEILEETGIVRRELGYPGMATPLSQFAGIQAALNVLTGERYSQVPVEVIRYLQDYYGDPVGPVDQNVLDKVSDLPLAKEVAAKGFEQPSLADLRRVHGDVSDDELILRATMAGKDVDAMLVAGSIRLDYPTRAYDTVKKLMSRPGLRHASCQSSSLAVSLSRQAPAY